MAKERQTCKPGSVRRSYASAVIIYLGPASLRDSSGLPGNADGAGVPLPIVWPCSARGFPCVPASPPKPVVSYTAFSPLPHRRGSHRPHRERRYIFCGTFRWVSPRWCYQPRCPQEPGLSSAPRGGAITRSAFKKVLLQLS